MQKRNFGGEDLTVGEVGLGCWQLGGSDWGAVSEEAAMATLSAAHDSGVNFFDTADVYGSGRSEELLGKFISGSTDKPFVATKVGRFSGTGFPDSFTFASIRAATEASLRRLQTDCLDLTQLHCVPTEILRHGEIFDWLRTLQQDGKIRRFGASVESMEEALLCLKQEGLVSLQIIFNLFRQKPITTLFESAREKKIALIVRLPLASGLLSGKYTASTQFGSSDHRTYNRNGEAFNVGETFAGLPFEKGVELADSLKEYVPDGVSLAQMAMRWILDYPEVTVVIPGARDSRQANENAAISDLRPLPETLHQKLADFYSNHVTTAIRGPY